MKHLHNRLFTLLLATGCALLSVNVLSEDEAPATDNDAGSEESSAENKPAEMAKRVTPDVMHKRHYSVEDHMMLFGRQDEMVLLNTSEGEFTGLFMQEEAGTPQGGVLILHDRQQHSHWPDVVAPLREYLPRFGWATLTIALPDAPEPSLPEDKPEPEMAGPDSQQSDADESTEEADNEEPVTEEEQIAEAETEAEDPEDNAGPDEATPTEPEDQNQLGEEDAEPALPRLTELPELPENNTEDDNASDLTPEMTSDEAYLNESRERIDAAVAYLQQRGQLNLVIIGTGEGGAWAVDYVSRYIRENETDEEDRGMALITVDPVEIPQLGRPLKAMMPEINTPFLELLSDPGALRQRENQMRRAAMKHAQQQKYSQIRVPQILATENNENPVTRRIRGWLKSNAAGTLVKVNE